MRIRLKHNRLAKELAGSHRSQNLWALKLGLSRGHLSLLVNGKRPYPNGKTRKRLLDGTGLSFQDLFEIETLEAARKIAWKRRARLSEVGPKPTGIRKAALMKHVRSDFRQAFRSIRKNKGASLATILILALGIGANTALFNFIDNTFMRPPNLVQADRVARVYGVSTRGGRFEVFSYPDYLKLRDENHVFEGVAAHATATVSLGDEEGAENLIGEIVSGNYFSVLGVNAFLGRTLQDTDDQTLSAHPVVVLGYGLWQRRFGADPSMLGRSVSINGVSFTVVGIAPRDFNGTFDAFRSDMWVPMMMQPEIRRRRSGNLFRVGWGWLSATGRLDDGVDLRKAQSDLDRVASIVQRETPDQLGGFEVYPASATPDGMRRLALGPSSILLGIVALTLLVACANIAGLMLSRVTARTHEIAIRKSLGASRWRLARLWLSEGLLLAVGAGALSTVVAVWAQRGLLKLLPPVDALTSFSPDLSLGWRALFFTMLVAMTTAVVFGLIPALRAAGAEGGASLKNDSGSAGPRSRLQGTFIVAQVAVSVVLLISAGLLSRSLIAAGATSPGFDSENLFLAELRMDRYGYGKAQGREFLRRVEERIRLLPGVRGAALGSVVPLGFSEDRQGVTIPGHEAPGGRSTIPIDFNIVGSDYWKTMGIPLLRGRDFGPGAPEYSIIINETMAGRYWPGRNPVGERIRSGTKGPELEIIGVVQDIKYESLNESPRPFMYASLSDRYFSRMVLHVRLHETQAGGFARTLQKEVSSIDPKVAATSLMTFEELRRLPLFPSRALASFSSTFGLLALSLSALGIYGMVSGLVGRRTREIGIRMALGADRTRVLSLFMGKGMKWVAVGLALGSGLALLASSLIGSFLFGITSTDPLTFLTVMALALGVTLLASWIPGRRASRLEPMDALRYD